MRRSQVLPGLSGCAAAALLLTGCGDAEGETSDGTEVTGSRASQTPQPQDSEGAAGNEPVDNSPTDEQDEAGNLDDADFELPEGMSEEVWDVISGDASHWEPSAWDFDDFDFPSCENIQEAIGGPMEELVLRGQQIHAQEDELDSFGSTCVWDTEPQERLLVEGDVEALWELEDSGSLVMDINVPPINVAFGTTPQEDAQVAGFYFEDDRAEELGAWVFAPQDLDLGASLSIIGVAVSYEGVDVHWGAGGAYLHEVDALTVFSNDWAIDAGIAVHDLLWD